jgi:MHS family alpha-ketoglutarate permease-like MFS transporter
MMGVGSLGIAVLPGYAQIGALAPVLLVAARLLQGLSLGGEYGTSATYLSEVASPNRRGFYSSFQYVTLTSGQLLALGVQIVLQQILTPEQMHDWGWRIAFVIGAVAAVTVMWLRRTMDESPNYKLAVESNDERGSLRILLSYPRECLTVVGLTLGGTIAFYTFTTYMQKFLINSAGLTELQSTWISSLALLLFVVIQPVAGAVSDRVGRRAMLIAFGITATLTTIPLMNAIEHAHSAPATLALVLIGMVIATLYSSVSAIAKAELFPVEVRALGVSLPYAIAVSLFGGSAETIALSLKSAGHAHWYYVYVSLCTAISLIVYWRLPDSRTHSQL